MKRFDSIILFLMNYSQTTKSTLSTTPGYQRLKLIRWGGARSNGTLAMTPCGENALGHLLKTFAKPERLGDTGWLRVHEPWVEALLFQLTTQLLVHGVSVTGETLKATLKTMLSTVEDSFPPFTPIGRKRGNEIAK